MYEGVVSNPWHNGAGGIPAESLVALPWISTLLLSIADNGAPGRNDTLTLTIWSSDGRLLLTSRWDGRRTIPQNLDGGDLVVH